MLLQSLIALVFVVATATKVDVPCVSDEDCSLNGVCTEGACVCDPGWTTLPFGENYAMLPGCGYLNFAPSPVTKLGPAVAFHGADLKTTSWGGSVHLNPTDGKYWMFAAEMAHHCTLDQWTTNSQVCPESTPL